MTERELLERLAVLLESGKVYFEFDGRDIYFELLPLYNEIMGYLPAQPSPDAPVQLGFEDAQ